MRKVNEYIIDEEVIPRVRGMHRLSDFLIKRALYANGMRFITKDKLAYLNMWKDFLNHSLEESQPKMQVIDYLDYIVEMIWTTEPIYKNEIGRSLNSKQKNSLRFIIKKHFLLHVLKP